MRRFFVLLIIGTMLFAGNVPVWAVDYTMIAPGVWAGAGDQGQGDVTHALDGDNVDVDAFCLTITANGTADDGTNGGSLDTFTIGAITDGGAVSAASNRVDLDAGGQDRAITVNIASVQSNGLMRVDSDYATAASVTGAVVTEALSVGGETGLVGTVGLTVGGNTTVNTTTTITAVDGNAELVLNGATNTFTGGVTLDDGGDTAIKFSGTSAQTVTGAIDGVGDGDGDGVLEAGSGNASIVFNNNIGATNDLSAIDLTGTQTKTFSGTVAANDIGLDGTGATTFNGSVTTTTMDFGASAAQANFATGSNLTGNTTVTVNENGVMNFVGNSTVTGTIGASSFALGELQAGANGTAVSVSGASYVAATTVDGTGTLDYSSTLNGTSVDFTANGDVNIDGAATISGNVTTTASNTGDLELNGTGNTVTGDVGGAGKELALLDIDGTTNVAGNTYATQVDVAAVSSLGDGIGDKAVVNTLNLQHVGATTVTGTLNSLDGTTGTDVAFSADGDLDINNTAKINNITTTVNGTGDVELNGLANTVLGDIGASGTSLGVLDIDNTTTISGDTYAAATNVGAVTAFTGSLNATTVNMETAETSTVGTTLTTGTLAFAADGELDVTGASAITGNVTTTVGSTATLVMTGDADVDGTVGATNSLAQMDVNGTTNDFASTVDVDDINLGTGTTTFHGDIVSATGMDIGASGSAIFEDTVDYNSSGAGGVLGNSGGDGTVTFNGNATVGVDIGTTADRMGAIYVSGINGTTVNFNGEIFGDGTTVHIGAGDANFALDVHDSINFDAAAGSTGTAQFADGADLLGATGTDGNVTSTDNAEGTLDFLGTSTVTGTIGSASNALGILVGGVAGKTVTINGDAYVFATTVINAGTVDFDSDLTGSSINLDNDSTATAIIGGRLQLTGDVNGVAGGTLQLDGGAVGTENTIAGDVGTGAGLTLLDLRGDTKITGTLDATTVDFTTDENLDVTGIATVGAATNTTGADGGGNLEMDADGNAITTVGAVGANLRFGTLDIDGTSTIGVTYATLINVGAATTFSGLVDSTTVDMDAATTSTIAGTLDATTLDYSANADLTVTGITTVTAVTNTSGADGAGTLEMDADGNAITTVGAVGANLRFGTLDIDGTSTIGATYATLLNVGDATTFSGLVDSTTVDMDAATTSTIAGTLDATTLDYSADADLTVTGTTAIAGAITVGTTGDGTLEMDGASNTIGGDIGDGTHRLGELDIDGTTTVTGDTYAVLTNVGAATGFTGNVDSTTLDLDTADTSTIGGTLTAGTLDFSDDADLTVTGTTAIAGAITVGTTGDGTLEMDGASNTIGGDIGALATRLGELDIDGTTTVTGNTYTVLTNVGAATGFTGDVNSTTLDLDAAATSTIGGTLDATTLDYSADADLTVTGVATVTDITNTTGSDDKGTLEFNGVATIAGQVGALGSALNSVITGATGTTSTFSGDAYVTDFELDGTGTVNMDGTLTGDLNFGANGILLLAASKNITGNVDNTTGADGAGTLTFKGASTIGNAIGSTNSLLAVNVGDGLVAGGVVTMGSNISATTTTVESGGTLQLNAARTITGNLTLADTIGSGSGGIIDVGTNTLSLSGTRIFTMPTNTSLDLEITSGSYGSIDSRVAGVGAAAVINNNSDVNITVANGYYIPTGVEYTIVNTAGAGVGGALSSLTMNTIGNRHVQFLPAGSSGNLIAKSDRSANGFASDATDVNARAVGEVLDNVTSPTTDMTTVLNTLEGLSGSDTDSALNTMEPSVDGGIIGAGNLSIGNMINAISNHFSMVRGAASGVSTGDADAEVKNTVVSTGDADAEVKNTGAKEMWAQAFGTYAKQDERKGIEGYRADVRGGALGVDLFASDKGRFGIGGGYSYNRIKPKKSSLQKTEADNMQGSLYYSYNNDVNYLGAEAIYFDLVGSFAYNMYEGKRNISVGSGINRTAKAEYDGQQYTTYGEAGYHIPAGGIDLTPLASLQYTHLHLEGYTEKGADALNLNVDKQDYDLLEMGLGLKISSIMRNEGFDIIPSVRGKWLYDFIADKTEVTSRFTGGGASFKTEGAKPAKSSFDIGGTLTFLGKSNVQIDFDYDFNIKNDYQSHNGAVTFKYGF